MSLNNIKVNNNQIIGVNDTVFINDSNLITSGGVFNYIGYLKKDVTIALGDSHTNISLIPLRGQTIKLKVEGYFAGTDKNWWGYFLNPYGSISSYRVVSYQANEFVEFTVGDDAYNLFIFNNSGSNQNYIVYIESGFAQDLKNYINPYYSKLAFCTNGILTINADHTFNVDYRWCQIGKTSFINVVRETNKQIVPRTDGSTELGKYSGIWTAVIDIRTGEVNIYMFNSFPSDNTYLYIIAEGNFTEGRAPGEVTFSTSMISPTPKLITDAISSAIVPLTSNRLYSNRNVAIGYENIDDFFNFNYWFKYTVNYLRNNNCQVSKYSSIDNEYVHILIPSLTTFSSSWSHIPITRFTTTIGDDGYAKCYLNMKLRNTDNFKGFYILTDAGWSNPQTNIKSSSDSNFIDLNAYALKSGEPGEIVTFSLELYLTFHSSETYEKDATIDFYELIMQDKPIPNIGSSDTVTRTEISDMIQLRLPTSPDAQGCVFMSLGDSITTETDYYYIKKLRQLLNPSKYYNLAVVGATWSDKASTDQYDGNPVWNGSDNNARNVLGNQVQKIINNPDVYDIAPDIIIIAAGTNDGSPISTDSDLNDIISSVDSHFQQNNSLIQISTPTFDSSDTYKEHRKTIGGAMRYCVCTLQKLYPKARIYILTPIQRSGASSYKTIQMTQLYISEAARHLGVPVIHVGEECGIQSDYEYQGAMWTGPGSESWDGKGGRDLVDGLHPNNSGGWKMAKYMALLLYMTDFSSLLTDLLYK